MKMNRGKWTEAENKELLRLRKENVGYRRIGAALKRTPHACTTQYSKIKQHMIRLSQTQSGLTRNNKMWSVEEDRVLKRMIKDERSMEDMIQELKRSEKAIAARMWMHTAGKKRQKVAPAKVETTTDIGIDNIVAFIRGLQQENRVLREKLARMKQVLEGEDENTPPYTYPIAKTTPFDKRDYIFRK
tara:strand:+ start:537 stop:1097 length:561 start_codon:yes stop_codon:yes gene_type:complete